MTEHWHTIPLLGWFYLQIQQIQNNGIYLGFCFGLPDFIFLPFGAGQVMYSVFVEPFHQRQLTVAETNIKKLVKVNQHKKITWKTL